jgi:glycosyltransferase involved in cell wall biosynthesis
MAMSMRSWLKTFERTRLRPWARGLRRVMTGLHPAPPDPRLDEWAIRQASIPDPGLPRLALLSILPPTPNGVASFAARFFADARWRLDAYAPLPLEPLETLFRTKGSPRQRFFPIQSWGQALPPGSYQAVIVEAGNSPHHVPTLGAASQFQGERVWLNLHEAQAIRFWSGWFDEDARAVMAFYRQHYPGRPLSVNDLFGEPGPQTPRGIRPLALLCGAERILVHSDYCAQKVREDLGDLDLPIEVLFHPLPPPSGTHPEPGESPLRVGHFGGLSGGKSIATLLAAMDQLAASQDVRLILAGYGAGRYAKRHRLQARRPWLEVHDAPPDDRLEALMASVHVAVQLRPTNHGESSGVVSQLLGMARPLVLSDIGSFPELGPVAVYVPPDVAPGALAQAILQAQSLPMAPSASLREQQSPSAFLDRLRGLLQR